ncbi:Extracellular metalloprotease [Seminavis robusta]|uniref:Extracellular metalloprotease n=1 Tax=Seminavis robusta TaxID=568900 RepID=A0A9N8HBR8_9STRA|nr:Extracellular metalloprotease [Seminavis robusta]|eukprot:Sro192_g082540.1 Extracellular metalloprotease (685) ;mRNA; r:74872-77515
MILFKPWSLLTVLCAWVAYLSRDQCCAVAHYHTHEHEHTHHDDEHTHNHDEHEHYDEAEALASFHQRHLQGRSCGTPEGDGAETEAFREWLSTHKCTPDDCPILEQTAFESDIDIRVVWHHITQDDGSGNDLSYIDAAISHLNGAFGGTGFSFSLRSSDIITSANSAWYTAASSTSEERAMKQGVREGDCSVLNIYATGQTESLGWATLPSFCGSREWDDGVLVYYQTSPGGDCCSGRNYHDGDTLVHLVGHWMGLEHTFHQGCSGEGDFVADTPAEAYADTECDRGRDTCTGAGQDGEDDVTNFMNFGEDWCLDHFTTLQIARMNALWDTYRRTDSPTDPPVTTAPVTISPRPTDAPVDTPTDAPVDGSSGGGDDGGGGDGICFSHQATVQKLLPKQDDDENDDEPQPPSVTPITDIELGDKILTASGVYRPVYAFAHRDTTTPATFLRIHTTISDSQAQEANTPLEVTPLHLIYLDNQDAPVTAESIQVGDTIQMMTMTKTDDSGIHKSSLAVVRHIETIERQGLYAPMTSDGTLVVDGVVSSCYVSLQPHGGNAQLVEMKWGTTWSFLSHHAMAHTVTTVPRLVCMGGLYPNWCRTYTDRGVAQFVQVAFDFAEFFHAQSTVGQYLLMVVVSLVCGPLYVLEWLLGAQMAVVVLGVSGLALVARWVFGKKYCMWNNNGTSK